MSLRTSSREQNENIQDFSGDDQCCAASGSLHVSAQVASAELDQHLPLDAFVRGCTAESTD